jgi:hypothetical protein
MDIPKKFHTALLGVLLARLLFFSDLSAAPQPDPRSSWGEAVGWLQLTVYLDQATGAKLTRPRIRVELRNAGENDLLVNLGTVLLAGPYRQYPDAVTLILTDAQGKVRRLQLGSGHIVGGRPYPLVVPLPAGSTFSIPVDLDKYWVAEPVEFDYKLKPGNYSIEAQFTGRSVEEGSLDAIWLGTLRSNQLRFEIQAQ